MTLAVTTNVTTDVSDTTLWKMIFLTLAQELGFLIFKCGLPNNKNIDTAANFIERSIELRLPCIWAVDVPAQW